MDVEGASHKQVVDLIKNSQDQLRLVGKQPKKNDSNFVQNFFYS